jgi:hypothetical protein
MSSAAGFPISWSNISAITAPFTLATGGRFALTAHGTWNGGSIVLEELSPNGSAYVPVISPMIRDDYAILNLPPGQYRRAVTKATDIYAVLTEIKE